LTPAVKSRQLGPQHPDYPQLLGVIASPPALWIRGQLETADSLAIAIVGTRRPTPYGMEVAERLASELAARGITIVSGLARGIDSAAHRGALDAGGRTVAVLGCGIDIIYPPENRELSERIVTAGAVLSQFAPGTRPVSWNFPARNRTLAGLTLGVVVVEAPERSGALITAGYAGELGREVFAVPGKITSEMSRGPHGLIIDGAKLVRDWSDIVQELPDQWRSMVRNPAITAGETPPPTADSEEGRVLAMLSSDEPQAIDTLIARAALAPSQVAAALVSLELQGWARLLEGQRWVRAGRA
jgi:DNA processing protein